MSLSLLTADVKVRRAVFVAGAEAVREAILSKKGGGTIKPGKIAAVGAASLGAQYILIAPIELFVKSFNQTSEFDYVLSLLAETLGITVALSVFEMVGAVPVSAVVPEGEAAPARTRKRSVFMKSLGLAAMDVAVAEVVTALLGAFYPSGGMMTTTATSSGSLQGRMSNNMASAMTTPMAPKPPGR